MYQKITLMASDVEAFNNQEIIELYVEARRSACEYDDYDKMSVFKSLFPEHYKRFSAVARKRCEIRKSVEAMEVLNRPIYWGTLTYNEAKNLNKEEIKRKEAFEKLNGVFEYVLLVEEYGGDNGRYHIHFLGVFRENKDFDSFKLAWSHSRQNLRLICEHEDIAKYLIKYLVKDLPRLRRNKNLSGLTKHYKECLHSNRWSVSPENRVKAVEALGNFVANEVK